jgi:hypothetical protein
MTTLSRLASTIGLAVALTASYAVPATAGVDAAGERGATALAVLPLTVVQVSDSALTLDSNSPATSGPHAMYASYKITNTSGASVANLTATISGFSGGVTLAGSQAATQYVGTLAAGQSRTLYWFLTYPSTFGVRNVLTVGITDGAGGTASGTGVVVTESMISAQAGGLTSSTSIGAGASSGRSSRSTSPSNSRAGTSATASTCSRRAIRPFPPGASSW